MSQGTDETSARRAVEYARKELACPFGWDLARRAEGGGGLTTKDKLRNAHLAVAGLLAEAEGLFTPDMRLTFVARHPDNDECYVIVGNDSAEGLRGMFDRIVREAK